MPKLLLRNSLQITKAACNYLCDVYFEQQNEECFSLKDAYCDVKQESPKKEDKGYVKISFLAGDDKDTPPEDRKDYVQYTMLQFLIEWPHEIAREYLEAGQSPQTAKEIIIEKTPEVMKRLQNFYDVRCNKRAQFSPSALNTYMDCQLKFYYTYVAKLKPKPEVSSEIDSAMLVICIKYNNFRTFHHINIRI